MIAMAIFRECSRFNLVGIVPKCIDNNRRNLSVFFHELRRKCLEQTNRISKDGKLTITRSAGTNRIYRNRKQLVDFFCYFRRNCFNKKEVCTSLLNCKSIFNYCASAFDSAPLRFMSTKDAGRLRCQSNMAKHENTTITNCTNTADNCFTTFEFNSVHAAFFQESDCITSSVFIGALIGSKGHITNNKRIWCTTSYRLAVLNAHIHSDRNCAIKTRVYHAERIANKNHVYASGFSKKMQTEHHRR